MASEAETKFYPDPSGTGQTMPQITSGNELPMMIQNEECHAKLLSYLQERLQAGASMRPQRLARYSRIDRMVSTWQELSDEDTQRKATQDSTGKAQAIHMNLPLVHTHLEDMVSFYAGVYSPAAGSFFRLDEKVEQGSTTEKLIAKMNGDSEASAYFKELCCGMRGLMKYNIGGFELLWSDLAGVELDNVQGGMNHISAIDMYNFFWDPTVVDPSKIREEAEWAASTFTKNRRWLIRREKKGVFAGLKEVFESSKNANYATYYRYPPGEAGVTANDSVSSGPGGRVNWSNYGAALESDEKPAIPGNEVVKMYCWLNPYQFDLRSSPKKADNPDDYKLWLFYIVDDSRIVYAQPVTRKNEDENTPEVEIPFYLGYLEQDEMGSQQRSIAELMGPFQNFASFLLNAHVSGVRSSIWGLQGYDPEMFDLNRVAPGSTSARIASKVPGRDVRSGLISLNSEVDTSSTMQSLAALMNIMKEFFPAQALPAQVASMDRAVSSQVAAVMQGSNRRQHMLVRVIDVDIMSPLMQAAYLNIVLNGDGGFAGLTNDEARRILGSGLQQLNREQAEAAFRQFLFAIIQNPETASQMDIMAMIHYWSTLLNIPMNTESFKKQAPAAPQPNQAPPGGQPSAQGSVPIPAQQ